MIELLLMSYSTLRIVSFAEMLSKMTLSKQNIAKQYIGKNAITHMPQKIVKYLDLPHPELYAGHAFENAGATIMDLKSSRGVCHNPPP